MIVNDQGGFGFGDFGGSWEDWCDATFPDDGANRNKCKGWGPTPPWTTAGAIWRGIPKPNDALVSIASRIPFIGGGAGQASPLAIVATIAGEAASTIKSGQQTQVAVAQAQTAQVMAAQQAGAASVASQSKLLLGLGGMAALIAGGLLFLKGRK